MYILITQGENRGVMQVCAVESRFFLFLLKLTYCHDILFSYNMAKNNNIKLIEISIVELNKLAKMNQCEIISYIKNKY